MQHRELIPLRGEERNLCEGTLQVLGPAQWWFLATECRVPVWVSRCEKCAQTIVLDPKVVRGTELSNQVAASLGFPAERCCACLKGLPEPGALRCLNCGQYQEGPDPLDRTVTIKASEVWHGFMMDQHNPHEREPGGTPEECLEAVMRLLCLRIQTLIQNAPHSIRTGHNVELTFKPFYATELAAIQHRNRKDEND